MNTDYFKLVRFLSEYVEHYKNFLDFEYKKLDMINNDRIEELTGILSAEQALIMKTTSMENKRLTILGEDKELSFREIIEKAPVSCKKRLEEQYDELAGYIAKIKEINGLANIIISGRLKRAERKNAELDTYNGKGAVKTEYASKAKILKNI